MSHVSFEELKTLSKIPLMKLLFQASCVHQKHHEIGQIESCMLLSVKTGNCSEDCAYCSQSIHYATQVTPHQLLDEKTILTAAKKAKEMHATHFCLSTSGREVKSEKDFLFLLKMIKEISAMGIRVCSTLGLLTEKKALQLKEAGLYAYNHNLDTGPKFYTKIITTRTYQDRLDTLALLQNKGIRICTGLILGMGESLEDRLEWLLEISKLKNEPDFIPVNVLIPQKGTPLEHQEPISFFEVLKMICLIRSVFPKTLIRFAGGRGGLSFSEQALTLMAGVNSFHMGEKLLTSKTCSLKDDKKMIKELDLQLI